MKTADFTIYDLIARQAALYDDREAVVGGGRRLSFADCYRNCGAFADGLRREGIAAGDRIAVLAGNEVEFLLLCGAAAGLGVVVVPINWRLGTAEIAFILTDTRPRFLFCSRDFRERACQVAVGASFLEKVFIFAGEEKAGNIPDGQGEGKEQHSELHAFTVGEGGKERGDAGAAPGGCGTDPFLIIHTAAVGGRPRGCLLSQDNIIAAALQIGHLLHLDSRDVHMGILPLFHIGGLTMTLAALLAGGRNVLVPRFDPSVVLRLIADEGGTFLVTFPPMLGALLDAGEQGGCKPSSLRFACGVDAPATIERFLGMYPRAAFFSLYGQTEAMPVTGGDYRERPGSIGRPALLSRVMLSDDLDREVPRGTPGEICVRSPAVFRGYWNLTAETAAASRNGWHHTGDLGRLDDEGYLWYVGRKPEKELIKSGGENVYPAEVEQAILDHAAIAETCVIGIPDPEWGEAVQAFCVLKEGCTVSAGELSEFVASRIARYKRPRQVVFLADLPKTPAGTVDREAVKRAYRS